MKKALITGITGQDGSYLADLLIEKGYEVHGIIRRASSFNTARIDHLYQDSHIHGVHLFLHYGDLCDSLNLTRLIDRTGPDEIYHLGAQSHVRVSFDIPEYTGDVVGLGTIRLLEALRETKVPARFYQASSSEMFGKVPAFSDIGLIVQIERNDIGCRGRVHLCRTIIRLVYRYDELPWSTGSSP